MTGEHRTSPTFCAAFPESPWTIPGGGEALRGCSFEEETRTTTW